MPEPEPAAHVHTVVSPYLHLTDAMLEARIRESLRNQISSDLEKASLLADWKRRGKNLEIFGLAGVANFLVLLGEGKLAVEVYEKYWPDVGLMKALSRLDTEQQRQLALGYAGLPVAVGEGGRETCYLTIEEIDAKGLHAQVFRGCRINTVEEQQRQFVKKVPSRTRKAAVARSTTSGIEIDRDAGTVTIGGVVLKTADVEAILLALRHKARAA